MIADKSVKVDKRRVYPVILVWGLLQDERKVPVMLDHKVQVMEAFTLYAQYKAKEYIRRHAPTNHNKIAYISFINELGYALKAFAEYLRSKRMAWQDVNDSHIEEFKLKQHDLIRSKPNSLTRETVHDTANRKLRLIYEFYWWAQHVQLLVEGRINNGIDAPIRSAIAKFKDDPWRYKKDKSGMRSVYPLCEAVTAEISRHRRQHYATPDELIRLRKFFRDTCDVLTAERNVLIVDIIDNMGWREGSIASLTVRQFSNQKIENSLAKLEKTISVTPAQQKRGYDNPYDATVQLVIRISRYIEDVRLKMFNRIHQAHSNSYFDSENSPLFISSTTGKALKAKTISRIISDGFKGIGVLGVRAGPHSIRRKFGKEKSSEIVQVRHRMGISTDPQDVLFDLAGFLGHSSLAAQNAYNADKRDIYTDSIENRLRGRVAELEAIETSQRLEVVRREDYIQRLEQKLVDLKGK